MIEQFADLYCVCCLNEAQARLCLWQVTSSADRSAGLDAERAYALERDMRRVIDVCANVLTEKPDSWKAYAKRALAWRALGHIGMWRVDLQQASKLAPSDHDALHAACSMARDVIGFAHNGAALDEWELWPAEHPARRAMLHVATRRPWGLEVRFPPPRALPASDVPQRNATRDAAQLATYRTSGASGNAHSPVDMTEVEIACISFLHPAGSIAYDEPARRAREDHACAFRWLAKLYADGYELCPASHFYLGRAFSRGECGVLVNLSLAEHFLYLVVSGSHDHTLCGSYSEMRMCETCIVTSAAHERVVAQAVDELLRLYSGGLRWCGWPDRVCVLLRARAKRPDAEPSAQFNFGGRLPLS